MVRRCMDCDSTDDVRAHPVDSWPVREWGPYYLCAGCRAALEEIDMHCLALHERRLLADWGTIGERRQA